MSCITHLVEVKDQIQFTHIPKELIQHLDEEVDSFEVCQLIVIRIHADTKEKPSVASVDDLRA